MPKHPLIPNQRVPDSWPRDTSFDKRGILDDKLHATPEQRLETFARLSFEES